MKKLIVLLVVALAAPTFADPVDLINSDLETGDLTGWALVWWAGAFPANAKREVVATLPDDPADKGEYVYEGNDYVEMLSAASDVWQANSTYTFSIDIWQDPAHPEVSPFITVNPADNNTAWSGFVSGHPWRHGISGWVSGGGWGTKTWEFTTGGPGEAYIGETIQLGLEIWSNSNNCYTRVDNVKLEQPQVYFVIIGGFDLVVEELGETTDTFSVALGFQPASSVTITVDPNDNEIRINGGAPGVSDTLTFTTSDWGTAQTVTIQAVDDLEYENEETTLIDLRSISADPNFNEIVKTLAVRLIDNDFPTIFTETDGATEVLEGDVVGDSYTVELASQPSASVTVDITDPAGQVEVSPTTLTFTTGNWDTAQTVTVTAIDDTEVETDPHSTLISNAFSSTDTLYNGLIGTVSVSILENDCGAWGFSEMDLNEDCEVNLIDFSAFAFEWLACTRPNDPLCNPAP